MMSRHPLDPRVAAFALALALSACEVRPDDDIIDCAAPALGFYGRVVDDRSGAPIIGAWVKTDPSTNLARTDRDGCFQIDQAPTEVERRIADGTYVIRIEPREHEISIGDGGDAALVPFVYASTAPFDYRGTPRDVGTIRLTVESFEMGTDGVIRSDQVSKSRGGAKSE